MHHRPPFAAPELAGATCYDFDVRQFEGSKAVAEGNVPVTAASRFGTSDCLNLGSDLGSPVSLDYYDQASFKFNGTIGTTKTVYPKKQDYNGRKRSERT
jgi:hypothetical protein